MQDSDIKIQIVSDSGFVVNVAGRSSLERLGKDKATWDGVINEAMLQIQSGTIAKI